MKLRHYKRNTFRLCIEWIRDPYNDKKLDMLALCLLRWVRSEKNCDPYGYHTDTMMTMYYASDRMNPGRALALMHMLSRDGYIDLDFYGLDRVDL